MAWRRVLASYFVWVLAHAVAGALFVFASAPFLSADTGPFFLAALLAGCIFGVAQWLALLPFLRDVRLWAPATIAASPVSWGTALMFAGVTLGYGGWLGGAFSAAAQTVVLALSARHDDLSFRCSFLWIPASVIGGAVFYFCYYGALAGATSSPSDLARVQQWSPAELIFVGSLAYGVVTGLVVALLVALAGRKSAPQPAVVTL